MRREEAREGKEGFKTLRKEENEEGRKEGEDEGRLRVGIKRKHQRCHCWKRPQKLHCYFIAGTAQMREAQRLACSRACPRAEPRCRPQLCPLGASGRKRKDRHVRGLSRTFRLLISRHESALLLLPKRGRAPPSLHAPENHRRRHRHRPCPRHCHHHHRYRHCRCHHHHCTDQPFVTGALYFGLSFQITWVGSRKQKP